MTSALEKLKKQRDQLDARIQLAENREKTQQKKKQDRMKILIGAYYFEKAKKENTMNKLIKELDPFLTRDSERDLFGLTLLEKKPETS